MPIAFELDIVVVTSSCADTNSEIIADVLAKSSTAVVAVEIMEEIEFGVDKVVGSTTITSQYICGF